LNDKCAGDDSENGDCRRQRNKPPPLRWCSGPAAAPVSGGPEHRSWLQLQQGRGWRDVACLGPEGLSELVLKLCHDLSFRFLARASSARCLADLTELMPMPIKVAISSSGRSR
jgi:hypothetical protein